MMPFALTACVAMMRTVHPPSPRAELRHLIDSLTTQPEFRNAQWGVLIVNPRTGDTLYSVTEIARPMIKYYQSRFTGDTLPAPRRRAPARCGTG